MVWTDQSGDVRRSSIPALFISFLLPGKERNMVLDGPDGESGDGENDEEDDDDDCDGDVALDHFVVGGPGRVVVVGRIRSVAPASN